MITVQWSGPITEDHPLYSKLSPEYKKWLIPDDLLATYNLPMLLLATGVSVVTPLSIKDIVVRTNIAYAHNIHNILAFAGQPYKHSDHTLTYLLNNFIGVSINNEYLPFRTWYARLEKPTLEARGIKLALKEYYAWERDFSTKNES